MERMVTAVGKPATAIVVPATGSQGCVPLVAVGLDTMARTVARVIGIVIHPLNYLTQEHT